MCVFKVSDSNLTLLRKPNCMVIIRHVTANKWKVSRNKNAFG